MWKSLLSASLLSDVYCSFIVVADILRANSIDAAIVDEHPAAHFGPVQTRNRLWVIMKFRLDVFCWPTWPQFWRTISQMSVVGRLNFSCQTRSQFPCAWPPSAFIRSSFCHLQSPNLVIFRSSNIVLTHTEKKNSCRMSERGRGDDTIDKSEVGVSIL